MFVHPDETAKLWETILDAGRPLGLTAAGLGARDSCRIEAGLPLFGHVSFKAYSFTCFDLLILMD